MSDKLIRVNVWPAILRLLHLLMASSMLILLLTGGFLQSGMILNELLYLDLLEIWHLPAGHVFAAALIVRLVLLFFGKGVLHIRALLDWKLQDVVAVAVFYASFARMQLQGYFAHNPLWKSIYLLFFGMSILQVFSGFLLESNWLRSVLRTDSYTVLYYHQLLFQPLTVIVLAHVLTAILHDWKSDRAEISAMINGHKFISIEPNIGQQEKVESVSVSLASLTSKDKNQ